MDIKQFLRTLPAFERFTGTYIDTLSGAMTLGQFEPGHNFIQQGQQGEAMYLLMDGAVEVSRVNEATGEAEEARELRAGELFGLLSLVDNLAAGATCSAKEHVTAAVLPRDAFHKLFSSAPPIGHHLQYMVAVQLARDLQERNNALRTLLQRRSAAA